MLVSGSGSSGYELGPFTSRSSGVTIIGLRWRSWRNQALHYLSFNIWQGFRPRLLGYGAEIGKDSSRHVPTVWIIDTSRCGVLGWNDSDSLFVLENNLLVLVFYLRSVVWIRHVIYSKWMMSSWGESCIKREVDVFEIRKDLILSYLKQQNTHWHHQLLNLAPDIELSDNTRY